MYITFYNASVPFRNETFALFYILYTKVIRMIFTLSENLKEIEEFELDQYTSGNVFLTDTEHYEEYMHLADMEYEGEIRLSEVGFTRIESQQECLYGSLYIPKLSDVLGPRYKIIFFVNGENVVIIDDTNFSYRLIQRIKKRKNLSDMTKERFLCFFLTQFMRRDQQVLTRYERKLMQMEEDLAEGNIEDFQEQLMPIRRELLTLRTYYDEVMDMGKELEENENYFFPHDQVKYLGTIPDRADRLMSKTFHIINYAQLVRDAYQSEIDKKQSSNMGVLTVVSAIFMPLNLITGWFGMNFVNMPGLENGYPFIIGLCVAVVVFLIILFRKTKLL